MLFGLLTWVVCFVICGCGFSGKGGSLFRPDVIVALSPVGAASGVTPGGEFRFSVAVSGTPNRSVTFDQIEDAATGRKLFAMPGDVEQKPVLDVGTGEYVWTVPSADVRLNTDSFPVIPAGSYRIRARSNAEPSSSSSILVVVSDATIEIRIDDGGGPDSQGSIPANPTNLSAGDTLDLKAIVTVVGGGGTAEFSVEPTGQGVSIDSGTGIVTTTTTASGTFLVKASIVGNPNIFALLTVTVVPAKVVITPANPTASVLGTVQLTAKVLDRFNNEIHGNQVTWDVLDGAGNPDLSGTRGTINASGLYTAPNTGGLFRVRATNPQTGAFSTVDILVKDARVVITPNGASLTVNGTQDFNAQVLDANDALISDQTVTWAAPDGGTVDSDGLFTAPGTPGQYRVTATSAAVGRTGTVTVLVTGDAVVVISTGTPDVRIGGTKTFTAQVRDGLGNPAPDQTINWSVVGGAGNGSINASGVYTAPNTPGQYQVRADNPATGAFATFTVVVTDVIVDIPELGVTLLPGQTYDFDASVTSQSDPGISQNVTWSASGGASIDANGLFTAPSAPGVYVVTATSTVVPRSDTVEVTVVAEGTVLVADEMDAGDPTRHVAGLVVQMPPNAIRSFQAFVASTIGGSVIWTKAGNGSITQVGDVVRFNSTGTANNQTVTLTARSVNDPTKFATVTIQIRTGNGNADGTIRRPIR